MNTSIRINRISVVLGIASAATAALVGLTTTSGSADTPSTSAQCFSSADAAEHWADAGLPLCSTSLETPSVDRVTATDRPRNPSLAAS